VNGDQPYWELLLLHHELLTIFLSDCSVIHIDYTSYLVQQHNKLVYSLTNNKPKRKCKLHYLTHYPYFFAQYGGMKCCWTMRFESRHQYFKQIARTLRQFKNIAYTCSRRYQLRMCLMMHNRTFLEPIVSGTINATTVYDLFSYEEMLVVMNYFQQSFLVNLSTSILYSTNVSIKGFNFSTTKKTALVYAIGQVENEPSFCLIEKLFHVCDDWYALCYPVKSFFFRRFRVHCLLQKSPEPIILKLKHQRWKSFYVRIVRCCQCVVCPERIFESNLLESHNENNT
jgi:hypothetical protein